MFRNQIYFFRNYYFWDIFNDMISCKLYVYDNRYKIKQDMLYKITLVPTTDHLF